MVHLKNPKIAPRVSAPNHSAVPTHARSDDKDIHISITFENLKV